MAAAPMMRESFHTTRSRLGWNRVFNVNARHLVGRLLGKSLHRQEVAKFIDRHESEWRLVTGDRDDL